MNNSANSAEQPSFAVSVVMDRIAIDNRWVSHKWQPAGILPDDGTREAGEVISDRPELTQLLFPGFALQMFADEAEGYYLNVSSPEPRVFVMWRIKDDTLESALDYAAPYALTLSYNEAARWMDAQEKVDTVQMPTEMLAVLSDWVHDNYKPPEKKQRIRPKSFESKEGRYKSGMS